MYKIITFALILSLSSSIALAGFSFGNIDLKGVYDTVTKTKDLGDKTEEEERLIGEEVSGILISKSRVLDNEALQRYVNRVGRWLAANSERPDLPWRFLILDDPGFNAFAAPGGHVYITTGALVRLQTEAQLAGILAHEIAHVLKKHYLESIKTKAKVGIAMDLGKLVYNSNNSNNSMFPGSAFGIDVTPEDQMLSAVDDLYAKGLDRGDELEADAMAMVIAARAGYDPFAYITVLQLVASESHESADWETFFKRHPLPEDRLEALLPVSEQPFTADSGYQTLERRYHDFVLQ